MDRDIDFKNKTWVNDTLTDENGWNPNGFQNPFEKLHVRVLFIIVYVTVFILCISGK